MTKEEKDARLWQDRKDIFDAFVDWEKQDSYKEGMSEGIESNKIDNALRMLKKGIDIMTIAECVDLSQTKIEELQSNLVTT